ncbi:hypothetical protein [Paraburkholderia humisilvae]|uniref:Uncharacterized protein n=1 Tax=Paraburkholderia humisilvae TaxID=627669 RepID=A0A6J5FCX9_9BURK|nr:hypothetical protein [Paraburkholderia humisilvae]CAB3775085.1 hypothetical protein LMG29542_08467 [Paraburkholderia humisilvae]
MDQGSVAQLAFIQAPDETGQDYLRDAKLAARDIRSAGGTSIMPALTVMNRIDGEVVVIATYVLSVVQAVGPIVGPAFGAWLQGRAGRKLRLKVAEIEVEARTVDQIDELLSQAKVLQANQGENGEA